MFLFKNTRFERRGRRFFVFEITLRDFRLAIFSCFQFPFSLALVPMPRKLKGNGDRSAVVGALLASTFGAVLSGAASGEQIAAAASIAPAPTAKKRKGLIPSPVITEEHPGDGHAAKRPSKDTRTQLSIVDMFQKPEMQNRARDRAEKSLPPKNASLLAAKEQNPSLRSASHANIVKKSGAEYKKKLQDSSSLGQLFFEANRIEVKGRQFFCCACGREVQFRKSGLQAHVKTRKHLDNISKKSKFAEEMAEVGVFLKKELNDRNLQQATIASATLGYRGTFVRLLAGAKIPLAQTAELRSWIEGVQPLVSLTDRSHLASLIPGLLAKERDSLIKKMPEKCDVAIIFDGCSKNLKCEGFVILFVDKDATMQFQLFSLNFVESCMDAQKLGSLIFHILVEEMRLERLNVLAFIHDNAPVNSSAFRNISSVFTKATDIGCLSHACNNAGEKINAPTLVAFVSTLNNMFSHSDFARNKWVESSSGTRIPLYNNTRWWAMYEFMHRLMLEFASVPSFLQLMDEGGNCSASITALRSIYDNPATNALLQVELAAVVELLDPLVRLTYRLEGDGPLALVAADLIADVQIAFAKDVSFFFWAKREFQDKCAIYKMF